MSVRMYLRVRSISPLVAGVLLVALCPIYSFGQTTGNLRDRCTMIVDAGIQAVAARTTPSRTSFPVIVHYMKHFKEPSGPGSKAQAAFPLDDVKGFFKENGDFNKVWGAPGADPRVTLVLVGVDTCIYALSDPDVTRPQATREHMQTMGEFYNVPEFELANVLQKFKGLNVYLWNDIEDVGGAAFSMAAMTQPSVWLAPDCLGGSPKFCDSKFAHEVGHFFGLCHVCTNKVFEKNPSTCGQTCQAQGRASQTLDHCVLADKPKLMADLNGTELSSCERNFAADNATRLLTAPIH